MEQGFHHQKSTVVVHKTIKDGKVIGSGCTELFTDSNENDLKRWVGTTISEDICSHEQFETG
jgi:hypothetical protein